MNKKLLFHLEQDEDGWPPAAAETVWAIERENGRYVVDNIPFFAAEATLGDLVEAEWEDGFLTYRRTVGPSENSLLRVIVSDCVSPVHVQEDLARLGCSTELMAVYRLIAVSVPGHVELSTVIAFLRGGAEDERWDYEEAILRQ